MSKKRIYVAYTGGTIGMQMSEQGYICVPGFLVDSVNSHAEFHRPEMPAFHIHEYSPLIDSSDMTPADWQRIANDIRDQYDQYDGFVILHGTDTMAYTASALSFMLEDLDKPVIVTGSQIPLSALRSDGQENLLTALYLAAEYPVPEVSLFFNHKLYRGNRCTKAHADGFDAFASPNMAPLVEAGIHIKQVAGVIAEPLGRKLKVHEITPQPIGVVRLYPGIDPVIIEHVIQQPVKALILQTYGVGNAPSNPRLLGALKEASERGVVIVNLSQCFKGSVNMSGYATGSGLASAGVISGHDMTMEAALTKLHFLLSQELDPEQIRAQMVRDLRGELSH
ncbi:asparaginase [Gallaecimonas sp. GXIMD4217]|uniref:asparaginase n=1 Tax=Gallaecimonas sp. GXIMD4217 TaxID=3131927 RepID=UPI00311AFBCC